MRIFSDTSAFSQQSREECLHRLAGIPDFFPSRRDGRRVQDAGPERAAAARDERDLTRERRSCQSGHG